MKKLHIISAVTDSPRFLWECRTFLTNLKEHGYSDKTTLLIFQQRNFFMEDFSPEWAYMQEDFPETEFVYYKDVTNITRVCSIFHYIPLFRLYVLQEYFKKNPQLEQEAILYVDSDIIFTKPIDFTQFLEDDINYVSWTGNPERTDNYLWQPYFDNKIANAAPERIEQYKRLDVLGKVASICGTTREAITANNDNIGGAQYLLKNITSQFWTDCFNACCEIKLYLEGINGIFMKGDTRQEKEDKGFQSFCADMWAVIFTLIAKEREIRAPKEMDFIWSTDRIEKLETASILHNAGVTSDAKIRVAFEKDLEGNNIMVDGPLFYKGAFNEKAPTKEHLEEIYNHPINKQFCNNIYTKAILKSLI